MTCIAGMTQDELKALLYRIYALGFEAGVNAGNHHHMNENWERQKRLFEKDIERVADGTNELRTQNKLLRDALLDLMDLNISGLKYGNAAKEVWAAVLEALKGGK